MIGDRPRAGRSRRVRNVPPLARCCAPSASARTTSASRRSPWPRAGTRSPLQLPPRQARRAREGRRPAGRCRADRVHDDRRERRHRDGPRGHEGLADEPRPLIADSVELVMHAERMDALVGIAGCDKSEPGMLMAMARMNLPSVYLYGGTILPGPPRARHHDPGRVRGRRRAREGSHRRRRAARHRARGVPRDRLVRRHVHREHDGGGRRGDRHVATGLRAAAGGRLPARGRRARVRRAGCSSGRRRRPAAARHHDAGLRERDRRGDGARRLDERRAAPARDCPRGPRRPAARRLRPHRAGRPTSSTCAPQGGS